MCVKERNMKFTWRDRGEITKEQLMSLTNEEFFSYSSTDQSILLSAFGSVSCNQDDYEKGKRFQGLGDRRRKLIDKRHAELHNLRLEKQEEQISKDLGIPFKFGKQHRYNI
jgi:hypothetical protein